MVVFSYFVISVSWPQALHEMIIVLVYERACLSDGHSRKDVHKKGILRSSERRWWANAAGIVIFFGQLHVAAI